jgi:hypothetical protein
MVPKQHEDRIGLLVLRAFVERGRHRRLLVKVIEVNPSPPDRVLGIVDSSASAALLVGEWLDSLATNARLPSSGSYHPVDGDG